jgi:hypothetical protein
MEIGENTPRTGPCAARNLGAATARLAEGNLHLEVFEMRWKILAVLAVAAFCVPGCTHTPTSGVGINTIITASIANSSQKATLLEAQLELDVSIIADTTSPTPASSLSLNCKGLTTTGSHTFTFLVANQTDSPNNYTTVTPDILVYDETGNFLREMKLPTMTQSVATGSGITYSFTL